MATRVKGVTIELSADATGIEQALKDVNKSLKSTQFQLREVEKSLQLDPGNLELIEQKQRLLAKATEETKKKLEALKAAQEDMKGKEATDENWKQYDALTREISKTEVEMQGLNAEQEKFAAEVTEATAKSSGFASALDKISTSAATVAEKTAAISAAAAGALVGLVALVKNSAESATGWQQTANEIGFTAEGVQKLQYASDGLGISMNDMTDAVGNMNEGLEKNEGAFKRIGVRVKDNNGEYKDSERIFNETVTALGQIENETERSSAATAIFGDKARTIAPAFEDGGKALQALGHEAESLGGIVSNEDVESLATFSNELNKVKTLLSGAFANAGAATLQALMPVFQAVADAARKFAQVIASVPPELIQLIAVVLLVVASISPIARTISGITSAMGSLVQAIPLVVAGIQAINASLASMAANPATLYILAIVAALAVLGVAIYAIVENWDTIKSATESAWSAITNAIQNSIRGSLALFVLLSSKASSAFEAIKEAIEDAKGAIDSFVNDIKSKLNKVKDYIDKIKDAFTGFGDKIKSSLNLGNLFDGIGGDANSAGSRIMNAFASGITGAISAVRNAINQLATSIQSLWDSLTGQARQAGTQTANAYADGYNSGRKPANNGLLNYSPYGGNGESLLNASPYGGGDLLGAINTLNSNLSSMNASAQPTNVNVMLSGSAANIFDTVQVQNSRLVQATGYHALA